MLFLKSFLILLLSFAIWTRHPEETPDPQTDNGFVIDAKVKPIIDAKCLGCHSADSKNDKAKEKLIWANLSTMDKKAAASTLDEVVEVIEKGEMPPAKFLERYPDKKLTEKEAKSLRKWADKSASKMLK
ncbi:MAG: heme-binding domain-containing protein [Cyclobacteriaceae bacterium]|nr:heme-binding domain-containing protein [Cyclobacteriaceae bacterium]